MKIEISEQVVSFLNQCPPDPRKKIRLALRRLSEEKGDLKALDRKLTGYYRLRIGTYRVIFRYDESASSRTIFCAFAEHRGVVYETFLNLLH
jgi:mRNA-degrading endonuclease RelE of RelBE toxin-antitoxin system